MTDKLLLTVPEACAALRISRASFYRALRTNALRGIRIGGRRLFPVAEIEAYVERLAAETAAEAEQTRAAVSWEDCGHSAWAPFRR